MKMFGKILSFYTDLIETSHAAELRRSQSKEAKEKAWPGTHWLKSVITETQGYEHYLQINLTTWFKDGGLDLETIEKLSQQVEAGYYEINVPKLHVLTRKLKQLQEEIKPLSVREKEAKNKKAKMPEIEYNKLIQQINQLQIAINATLWEIEILECPIPQIRAIRYLTRISSL
jgi:hypothetical protein